jgi:two-component system, sensor histidine kinase and response regulator
VPDVSGPRSRAAGTSGHVLLAEDNPINQRVAKAMLEHLGFDVDVVADGADAVEAAILTPYRAILMDCQLPGLDGFRATAEIRRRQGSSRRTPVIAVTGSTTPSEQQRCLAAGMDDYLAKPVSLRALGDMLARWCPDGQVDSVALDAAAPGPAAEAAAGPEPTVLDARVVGRLERLGVAAGEDLVGQLATLFLADAETRISGLRQALADDDAAAVVRCAHTLRGSSANLGATELARLCATLSTHDAAADRMGRSALFDGIEAELGRVRSALGSLVPTT